MGRIRHGWFVVVLGLCFVAGCKKDGAGGGGAAGNSSGGASSVDDLSLLPRDAEVVLGVNVAQAVQSGLWKQFVEPKLTTDEATRHITEFKTKCGVDPMAVVKSFSLGVKGAASGKPDGVAVVHGMPKAKAMSCLDTMKDDMAKDGLELTRDGDVVTLKNTKASGQLVMTYVNDTTALAVFGEQASAATLKAAQASDQSLKTSQPFLEMYKKINTNDSVWLLLSGKMLEKGAALGIKPTAMFGSFNVTDGLTVDMRVRFATPEEATNLANMAKGQSQQAAKMFDKIDIASEASDVKISIALSAQKLKDLVAQLSGMFSMFGGMGGQQ